MGEQCCGPNNECKKCCGPRKLIMVILISLIIFGLGYALGKGCLLGVCSMSHSPQVK